MGAGGNIEALDAGGTEGGVKGLSKHRADGVERGLGLSEDS